jgi:hypothetical protein
MPQHMLPLWLAQTQVQTTQKGQERGRMLYNELEQGDILSGVRFGLALLAYTDILLCSIWAIHKIRQTPVIYYGRDGHNMQHSEQRIYCVKSGAWETESEGGGYYYLSTLGVWIEMLVRNGQYPHKKVGARWTIDRWLSYQDTFAFRKTQVTQAEELWRVEIPQLVTTGWRDGSIGGPDGEQPSRNVWTLWGLTKNNVRCLPLGSSAPDFEFALFLQEEEMQYWENNLGENFRLRLGDMVKPAVRDHAQ